jgi:UDP-N-acetylmuramoylalanine--D-glutamate ligase
VSTALVVGLGVTGQALVGALRRHGHDVTVVDDRPAAATRAAAVELGVDLVEAPDPAVLDALVRRADLVLPSPGVPDHHPVFAAAAAAAVPVRSELDLAADWDQRPFLAITGTDGKTTVVSLVVAMLRASGLRAVEAGNTEVPLVAAIADPSPEVFVVEASSFRLAAIDTFRAKVGTWLNFAPDHQDAHANLARYEAAKAKVFEAVATDGLAVANADDPVVVAHAKVAPRVETFGLGPGADWHVAGSDLCTPDGTPWVRTADLWRTFPHDLSNFLAAAATAVGGGATLAGAEAAAVAFQGLPHRVSFVAESGGVRWYDDSKATAPHATLAAIAAFDRVVLIAGGRNKGLDLATLGRAADRLRGVVAIGEAAADVTAALAGHAPVVQAGSMDEAVAAARDLAGPGDAVLLSPGCASFDWYGSYRERGDDFIRAVTELLGAR